ncbi:MAG: NnrU family protein [Robiginitomaculum sp.]|nr:MAG: NnrU family protein [Robiginitomaculum sp.]
MYFLVIGALVFFAAHLYSTFRTRVPAYDIRKKLGYMKFMGIYSLVSGIGFGLMVWGYGLARPSKLIYTPPEWGAHIALALMLPAFILLVAAYGPRGYMKQSLQHPMLYAVILWAGAHMVANGELNSVILFGSFLAFSIINRLAIAKREQNVKRATIFGDIHAILVGALIYWLMLTYLHPILIGVPINI